MRALSSRAVTVLSRKKNWKIGRRKKGMDASVDIDQACWFSLGTVKNKNVLYCFLHVRVLKDSNLLNLLSCYSTCGRGFPI